VEVVPKLELELAEDDGAPNWKEAGAEKLDVLAELKLVPKLGVEVEAEVELELAVAEAVAVVSEDDVEEDPNVLNGFAKGAGTEKGFAMDTDDFGADSSSPALSPAVLLPPFFNSSWQSE
jgi:hypothetical protein